VVELKVGWCSMTEQEPADGSRVLVLFRRPGGRGGVSLLVGEYSLEFREFYFPEAPGFCTADECISWSSLNEGILVNAIQGVQHA
jgi:hypothetical protein